MRRKIMAAMLALSMGTSLGTAAAEQPAAEEYRQIFQSGNFYVEYKDNYTVRIIGEKDGKRMERTRYESGMSWMAALNPLGMLFGGSGPKYPEVLHKNGKYYQFTEKNKTMVCDETQLNDENLDPRQGWNGIQQKLALPTELAVFYWADPYRGQTDAIGAPNLAWSGRKALGKGEYDCDRYESRIKSASGDEETYYVYDMFYDKGILKEIRSYVRRGGNEYAVNALSVKKISGSMPDDLFKIGKDTKIYAAGMGDMNDLLERPVEVGTMEGI